MSIGIRESHARIVLQAIMKGPSISVIIHMGISISYNVLGCQLQKKYKKGIDGRERVSIV
jgi:hypothetical protein